MDSEAAIRISSPVEVQEQPPVVLAFKNVFEAELKKDHERYGKDRLSSLRALKQVWLKPEFKNQELSNEEIYSLLSFLRSDGEVREAFDDWASKDRFKSELMTWPQHIRRIYYLGRKAIKKG